MERKFKVDLRRLRAERILNGYTQEDMAMKMGFKNRGSYAKRENGEVSIGADELPQMAEILNVPLENLYIFYTENVPENERSEQEI